MTVYPTGPQDGIPYVLTAPDGSRAVFNDDSDADYVGLASVSGLESPEIREAIDDRSASDGAIQGLNFRGRRPVVIDVEIVDSPAARNAKWAKLRRAANALRNDATLDFTPDGGLASRVYLRLSNPIRRGDDNVGLRTRAQVPLISANPYILSQTLRTGNGTVSPVTLTNQGDGPAAPTIQVTVPAASGAQTVALQNQTSGQQVLFSGFDPAAYNVVYANQWVQNGPGGVAVDGSGNVWVTNLSDHQIDKYNSAGVLQASYGSQGTGNGKFNTPTDIAFDSGGNFFVVDSYNNRVQKFNSSGVYQSKFGTAGTGNGQFSIPTGIAIDQATNNMFVTDTYNNRVQKFNSAGTYQTKFGTAGNGNGQFNGPTGITLTSAAAPVVVDTNNNRVQVFSNAATPAYVSKFGSAGTTPGKFNGPRGIKLDSSGNAYIADFGNNRVQKFNSSGSPLSALGSYGGGDGQFNGPGGLALDSGGTHLYVTDTYNFRVQDFTIGSTAVVTFNFATASVTVQDQNVYRYIDVLSSEWWSLGAGDSSILVLGATSWTASWRDTWL